MKEIYFHNINNMSGKVPIMSHHKDMDRMRGHDGKGVSKVADTRLGLKEYRSDCLALRCCCVPCSVLTTVMHGSEFGLRMFTFSSKIE